MAMTPMPRRVVPPQHHAPTATPARPRAWDAIGSDGDFVSMLDAYRRSGGLARACEAINVLEPRRGPDLATLARWIVERRVISFAWQTQTWLPWFQFKCVDRFPDSALELVVAELAAVYDDWEMAHWFARPNSILAGRMPVERVGDDPDIRYSRLRVRTALSPEVRAVRGSLTHGVQRAERRALGMALGLAMFGLTACDREGWHDATKPAVLDPALPASAPALSIYSVVPPNARL